MVLVHNDVSDAFAKPGADVRATGNGLDRLQHDGGIVKVPALLKKALVGSEPSNNGATLQRGFFEASFAQDVESVDVVFCVDEAPQHISDEVRGCRETCHFRMAVHEKCLLYTAENTELQEFCDFGLEEIKAETMDRADVHFRQAVHFPDNLLHPGDNSVLQLGCGLFGERECHDVARKEIGAVSFFEKGTGW